MVRQNLEDLAREAAEERNDPENYEHNYKFALTFFQLVQSFLNFIE